MLVMGQQVTKNYQAMFTIAYKSKNCKAIVL